jgi:tetratricopeptide (TPR) repeat protein
MSKPTESNLFMFSPFASKQAGFYQDLLKGVLSYPQLGNRLIRLAEQAHIFRQYDTVKEYGQLLANFPLKPYQAIGHYFLAVAANSKGNGDQNEAKRLFELVVDTAPDAYKAKSVMSLGALAFHRGDFDAARNYLQQTMHSQKLSVAGLQAIRGISVLKSCDGDHAHAIRDLENILPVIRYAPAHIYFDLLNSYAVELGEVGRKDEARNVMRVVLASPYAFAYPEWRETAEDLKPSRRSFVAVGSSPYNVLAMPERERDNQASVQPKPARVLNFARLKKKMDKKDKDQKTKKAVEDMTMQDLGWELIGLITENHASEEQLRQLVYFAMTLFSEPDEPDPDKPAS